MSPLIQSYHVIKENLLVAYVLIFCVCNTHTLHCMEVSVTVENNHSPELPLEVPELIDEIMFENNGSVAACIIKPETTALFQGIQKTIHSQAVQRLPLSGCLFWGNSKTVLTEHAKEFARQCSFPYILFNAKALLSAYKNDSSSALDLLDQLFTFAEKTQKKFVIIAKNVHCLRQFIIDAKSSTNKMCTFMKNCRSLLLEKNTHYTCIQLYTKPFPGSELPKNFKHTDNIVDFNKIPPTWNIKMKAPKKFSKNIQLTLRDVLVAFTGQLVGKEYFMKGKPIPNTDGMMEIIRQLIVQRDFDTHNLQEEFIPTNDNIECLAQHLKGFRQVSLQEATDFIKNTVASFFEITHSQQ